MSVTQMLPTLLLAYGIPLVLLPTVGGGLLFFGYQYAGVARVAFWQCWKVYLSGCCYGLLALIAARFVLRSVPVSPLAWVGSFAALQLLLVPLLLRNYSRRALGVAAVAVLVANLAAAGAVMALRA